MVCINTETEISFIDTMLANVKKISWLTFLSLNWKQVITLIKERNNLVLALSPTMKLNWYPHRRC